MGEKRVKELQEGGKESEQTDKTNDKEEEKTVTATETATVSSGGAEVEPNTSSVKSTEEPAPVSESPATEEPMETEAPTEAAASTAEAASGEAVGKPEEKEETPAPPAAE